MKPILLAGAALALPLSLFADPFQEAEVTRVVNSVSLLNPDRAPKPASVGNVVSGKTAVQTGNDSRTELEFPDKTITRLGANALFRFEAGTREMDLERGTILFSSPKGEGGGKIQAGAVTAAVTGTNFLLGYIPGKLYRLTVLEGKVIVWLTAFPGQRTQLKAGQSLDFNPTSGKLPALKTVDLKKVIASSRLVDGGGFKPLPSQKVIILAADRQQSRIIQPKPPKPPATVGREQQIAQQTRNTTQQPNLPPKPAVKPTPPKPTPPKPTATPPKPPGPRPTPPHTGGGGTGGTIGGGGSGG